MFLFKSLFLFNNWIYQAPHKPTLVNLTYYEAAQLRLDIVGPLGLSLA